MTINKRLVAVICIFLATVTTTEVFASVLGDLTGGYDVRVTDNAVFSHYTYKSGDNPQSEYYVEYTPDSGVIPVIINGSEIYGKRTLLEAVQYMSDNGMKPVMGINADYYSFKTGIPMGHTIIDGELVTSDPTGQNAVGFRKDGTGFISWLEIQSRFIKSDGSEMMLDCINKWCQPTISASYLLTDKFGASTMTSGNCKFIIFSPVRGKLAIEDSITLRVDEKFDYDGNIAIPAGKLVLVMTNGYGDRSKLDFMDSLEVGSEVELKTEAVYDKEKWKSAYNGTGTVGGRLIENGVVYNEFEAGTAPRTAVGVKADGKIVFYVIDGRQPEVSVGIQIKTLAERMYELGCVDAVNLDGGGSTAMGALFPGNEQMSVVNSPSEGGLRKCANYIFLRDMNFNKPSDAVPEQKPGLIFADMGGHWAETFANDLYHKGIVKGEVDSERLIFRPESNITRGEFAVMICRYLGVDTQNYSAYTFDDYSDIPDWQKPYANAVAAEGIIRGKTTDYGTVFAGGDSITRAEAFAVLRRTAHKEFEYSEVQFADSASIPEYAKDAVNLLVSLGIVGGYEDGTLRPSAPVTRAESAKIIFGCYDIL